MASVHRLKRPIWETLERLRSRIGLTDAEFADLLKVTPKQFRTLRTKRKSPSIVSVEALAERLRLNLDHVISGSLDYAAAAAHFGKKPEWIPERYGVGAFSRRRTSINVLAYIEHFQGWAAKDLLLRRFQMQEDVFEKPDERINILFLSDLLAHLKRKGVPDSVFYEMGSFSSVTNRSSGFASLFAECSSPREIHELCFGGGLVTNFDENYSYRLLSLGNESSRMEAVQNAAVCDALGVSRFGNEAVCLTKTAVTASLMTYRGLPQSRVVESRCIHRGDPSCVFEIDYSEAARYSNPRARRPRLV